MDAVIRKTLVLDVERKLLRWLAFENAGRGGVLPPIRRLAIAYGVGVGVVREAVQRLEAMGIVESRKGAQFEVAPAHIIFSPDTIPALFRAAPSDGERLRIVRAWISLKWIVALEAYPYVAQFGNTYGKERVIRELVALGGMSRVGEDPSRIADQELYAVWNAAHLTGHSGIKPIINGLVRCLGPLREVWPVLVDEERTRNMANRILDHFDEGKTASMRQVITEERHKELEAVDALKIVFTEWQSSPNEPERACADLEVTEPGAPRWN